MGSVVAVLLNLDLGLYMLVLFILIIVAFLCFDNENAMFNGALRCGVEMRCACQAESLFNDVMFSHLLFTDALPILLHRMHGATG